MASLLSEREIRIEQIVYLGHDILDPTRKLNDFSKIFVKQIKTFLKREKRKYFVYNKLFFSNFCI